MANMDAPRNWGVSKTGRFGLEADVRSIPLNDCNADKVAVGSMVVEDRSQPKADLFNQVLQFSRLATKRHLGYFRPKTASKAR